MQLAQLPTKDHNRFIVASILLLFIATSLNATSITQPKHYNEHHTLTSSEQQQQQCALGGEELCQVSRWYTAGNGSALSIPVSFPSILSRIATISLMFQLPSQIVNITSGISMLGFKVDRNCDDAYHCSSMIDNGRYYLLDSYRVYFPKDSFKFNVSSYESSMFFSVWNSEGVLNVDPKSMRILIKSINSSTVLNSAILANGVKFDLNELAQLNFESISIQIVTNSQPEPMKIQMGEYTRLSYKSSFILPVKKYPDRNLTIEFSEPTIPILFSINQYRSHDMNFNSNSNGNNGVYTFLDALSFEFKTENDTNIPNYISRMTIQYIFQNLNQNRTDINGNTVELSRYVGNNLLVAKQFEGVFYKDSYTQLLGSNYEELKFELNPIKNQTIWSIMGQLNPSPPSPIVHHVFSNINATIAVGESIYFSVSTYSRKLQMEGTIKTISLNDKKTSLEIFIQDNEYDSISLPTPEIYSEKFTLTPNALDQKIQLNLASSQTTKNIAFLFQCKSDNPSEKCSFNFMIQSPNPLNDLIIPLAVSLSCIGAILVLGTIISVSIIYCRIFKKKSYVNLN